VDPPNRKDDPFDAASALTRRRSAVLFADLVESVRLFQGCESRVIERWHAFTSLVERDLAPRHFGRLVRTAGDGLLLEFESSSEAAAAAHAMHAALSGFNSGHPESEWFWLRIGIHVAEIVPFPHEIYGAGVNIAARLAALAQPGQTLCSSQTRQDLADGVHATVHDLGQKFVKHLDEPLRVFRLEAPTSNATAPAAALATSDLRPTVAVVPFFAAEPGAGCDALGHALVDDIIASLARHPSLRVLSRMSTALLQWPLPDPATLRCALNASFLLTGRYHTNGERVRLSFELCELDRGAVVWTGRTVGNVNDLFEGTDELVPHVVAQVSQQILGHELSRARSLPVDTLSSYSLFVGASGLMTSPLKSDFEKARQVLEHLVERHPRHAAPVAQLARWEIFALEQGWLQDRKRSGELARDLCQCALERDPGSAAAHAVLALVCSNFESDLKLGRELNETAITLDPGNAVAWAQLSGTLAFLGEAEAACKAVQECLRLSPLDPYRYEFEAFAAMACIAAGFYARAVAHATSSVRQHGLHAPGLHLMVGALWLDGQHQAARRTAERYLALFPRARAGRTSSRRLGWGLEWRETFEEALESAGIPP